MTDTYLSGSLDARQVQWDELLRQQRELEDEGMARGAERFRKRLAQAQATERGSNLGAARKLVATALDPLEAALTFFITDQKTKRGMKHCAVKWIERVGTDVAAYMTVKVIFDRLAGESRLTLREAAHSIVTLLQDELRFRLLEEKAPGLYQYKINRFTTTSYAHMARSLNSGLSYASIDASDIDIVSSQKLLIGTKLIDLMVQATGLLTVEHEQIVKTSPGKKVRVRNELYITPTPETVAFMQKRNAVLEFMAPVNLPMVVPPLQWSPGHRGGYRYALRGKYPLVRGASSEHETVVSRSEIPDVYTALNAIQNTAWKINTGVLAVVNAIVERGGGVVGIPHSNREDLPARPDDIVTNADARKTWRRAAHAAQKRNHIRDCEALAFSKVVAAAERIKDAEAFFFPHNLDFRGRIYPVSTFLSPQGDDLSKGLLTFAQGKALGSDGARWLAIHGANCMGETPQGQKTSKMTLEERIEWVESVTDRIELSVVGESDFWMAAEEPLQFLAFCIEWAKYVDYRTNGMGEQYVCSLPVSQDGSCNGLQHFSAMLRDERGGKAVNLVPGDRPQDVYDDIRSCVEDYLEARAADNPLAAMWLGSGLITRKLTKRPTMTFSYGSKPYGFQEQIAEYLLGLEEWPTIKSLFAETNEKGVEEIKLAPACGLMSQAVWHSLRDVVVAAFYAMEWLQKCAREVVRTGKPVEWIVPLTGFHVRQEYFVIERREIRTMLAGRIVKPRVYDTTNEVQAYKQANAVAPNVVHSLDAAALMLTMTQCSAEGVESFAAIHDSYGSLPADMTILARATRQSFVRLYQTVDVVADLLWQFSEQAGEGVTMPAAPPRGTLDISHVLVSDFFFS